MKKNTLYNFSLCSILLSMVVLFLNSCREDFDFIEAYRANPQYVYKENFENAFGKIDPNQSWDFTSTGSFEESATRAGEIISIVEDSPVDFKVTQLNSDGTLKNSVNGENSTLYNKLKSTSLTGNNVTPIARFESNGDEFRILPLTTQCSEQYSMFVKVGDNALYQIFNKSWGAQSYPYCDNMALGSEKIENVNKIGEIVKGPNKVYKGSGITRANLYGTRIYSALIYSNNYSYYAVVEINSNKYICYYSNPNIYYLQITGSNGKYSLASTTDYKKATPVKEYDKNIIFTYDNKELYIYDNNWTRVLVDTKRHHDWSWDSSNDGVKAAINNALNPTVGSYNVTGTTDMPGVIVNAPIGTPIEIYVESSNQKINNVAELKISFSRTEQKPDIFIDGESARYFGIDCNGDNNYQDLTFAIVGNNAQKSMSVSKRYMVEDLGAVESSDIDFNDIVFDIESSYRITGIVPSNVTQTAIVRALGGTLDIAIKIDDQEIFRKSTANNTILNSAYRDGTVKSTLSNLTTSIMYNTGTPGGFINYEDGTSTSKKATIATINLSSSTFNNPWNPATNNVKVLVSTSKEINSTLTDVSGQTYTEIGFPANGTVPAMIAVPTTQKWNYEKVDALHEHGKDGCYLKLQDLTSKPTASVNE